MKENSQSQTKYKPDIFTKQRAMQKKLSSKPQVKLQQLNDSQSDASQSSFTGLGTKCYSTKNNSFKKQAFNTKVRYDKQMDLNQSYDINPNIIQNQIKLDQSFQIPSLTEKDKDSKKRFSNNFTSQLYASAEFNSKKQMLQLQIEALNNSNLEKHRTHVQLPLLTPSTQNMKSSINAQQRSKLMNSQSKQNLKLMKQNGINLKDSASPSSNGQDKSPKRQWVISKIGIQQSQGQKQENEMIDHLNFKKAQKALKVQDENFQQKQGRKSIQNLEHSYYSPDSNEVILNQNLKIDKQMFAKRRSLTPDFFYIEITDTTGNSVCKNQLQVQIKAEKDPSPQNSQYQYLVNLQENQVGISGSESEISQQQKLGEGTTRKKMAKKELLNKSEIQQGKEKSPQNQNSNNQTQQNIPKKR